MLLRLDEVLVVLQDLSRELIVRQLDDRVLAGVAHGCATLARDQILVGVEVKRGLSLRIPMDELDMADEGRESQLEHEQVLVPEQPLLVLLSMEPARVAVARTSLVLRKLKDQ